MKIIVAYAFLFFGLGINYIFNVVVARELGPELYGHYSYALYIFNIFSLIAVVGLDEAALRFIPQSSAKNEERSVIQVFAILSSIAFVLLYLALIKFFLGQDIREISYLFALSLPLFVFITVNTAILQAHHIVGPRMAFRYALEPILKILLFFIFANFVSIIFSPVYAIFIALLVTNVVAIIIYRKHLFIYQFNATREKLHRLVKFLTPMLFYNVINIVSGRLDVLVLGAIAAASDVGQYSAAFQTSAMLAIVLQGLETVYAPIFSSHIGKHDFVSLREDYRKALRWTMLISSPVIIDFLLFPELALIPFGSQYDDAASILAILCFGQFINLATGSANAILLAMGKTRIVLLNSILYLIASVLFIGIGTYVWGVKGAAIGVVGAITVPNILRVLFVYKISKCTPFSRSYFKIIQSLVLTLIIAMVLNPYLHYVGVILYPVMFIVFVIVFGLHIDDKKIVDNIYCKCIKTILFK